MAQLDALDVTQKIGWLGRAKVWCDADGAITFSNAAEDGFTSIGFQAGGKLLIPQTTSAAPTLTEFPDDGNFGVHYNSANGIANWYYNVSGVIVAAQSDSLFYNPLSYYLPADGTNFALCFDRCFRAMESPDGSKALVMTVPYGIYEFSSTANLPQTSDADLSKARLLINLGGAVLHHSGFQGPMFARTSGTPVAESLLYTIENFSITGVLANTPYSNGTLVSDLDQNPFGYEQGTVLSAFKLTRADHTIFRNMKISDTGIGIHLVGCQNVTLESIATDGECCSLYCEPDGNGRLCKNIHMAQCRLTHGPYVGTTVWLEEVDDFSAYKCIFEGPGTMARANVLWKCNDNTTCKRLSMYQTWEERTAGTFQDHIFVQNKAEDAVVYLDGVVGAPTSYVRYADQGVGNLVVCAKNNHVQWDSRFGAGTVSDPVNMYTFWTKAPAWDSGTQYAISNAVSMVSPIATATGKTPMMTYLAIAVPGIGEVPSMHWTPRLSGETANYYPLGSRVYLAGEIFESRVASPSTSPVASTTTADWEYIGPAAWMPMGQRAAYSSAPTTSARNVGQDPKATGAGGMTAMLYDLHNILPILNESSSLFDNFSVPSGYVAEGYERESAQQYTWWRVMNGVEVS